MRIILKTVTKCLIKSFRITAGFQHQASPSPAREQDCWADTGSDRELRRSPRDRKALRRWWQQHHFKWWQILQKEDGPLVQWLKSCPWCRGRGFNPWSAKSPHAEGQIPYLFYVSMSCVCKFGENIHVKLNFLFSRLLVPCGFSRQEYWNGLPCPPPGGSSQPRDWTQVSHSASRFFTYWATREAQEYWSE